MDLLRATLFSPSKAADRLLRVNVRSDVLWTALILMGVLNALVNGLSLHFAPPDENVVVPTLFMHPLLFALASVLSLIATVYSLFWLGRYFHGKAEVYDVLILVTWLQVLRILAQLLTVVLMISAPGLAALLMLIASIWGIVILVVFINKAHQFTNPFKGLLVLAGAMIATVIGLSIVFGALGASIAGVA